MQTDDERIGATDTPPPAKNGRGNRPKAAGGSAAFLDGREDDLAEHRAGAPDVEDDGDDDRTDEFLRVFAESHLNSVLPNLPEIPGFHVCWLTTSNARDSIPMRLRQGYKLLQTADFPDFKDVSLKTGDYAGHIGINEMVAAKLPQRLYKAFMRLNHHDSPLSEEDKIRATIDNARDSLAEAGSRLEVGDGVAELNARVPTPTFSD